MRTTQLGAGWTKSPRPVLRGRSAAPQRRSGPLLTNPDYPVSLMGKVGRAQYYEALDRAGFDKDYEPVTEVVVKGIRNTLERFRTILGLKADLEHNPEPGCGTDERR